MPTLANPIRRTLSIALFVLTASAINAFAASFTAIADGNWTTAATWSCTANCVGEDGIPDADDTVTIPTVRVVTVTGAQAAHILTVSAGGTLTLNAGSSVTMDGTAGSSATNAGTTNGTGILRTTPGTGTTAINLDGTFTAALEIGAGTTNASSSTIGGPVTILSGGTMGTSNQTIIHTGDLTVNAGGSLITPNGGTYNFNGANLVNDGTMAMTGVLNFNGGAQNFSGTGTLTGDSFILTGTTVTLTSNVTFGNGNVTSTSIAVSPGGTFAVGTNTLTLNGVAVSGAGAYTSTGAGLIRTQGTSSITSGAGFTAPFEINTGTTSASGTVILGALTVSTGATFATINQAITINGDLTNNGSITKGSGGFGMAGANIVNNGSISGPGYSFSGTGTQNLSGTGTFTGTYTVSSGSATTLTSNVIFGNGALATSLTVVVGGTLAVGGNTLTLNGVSFSVAGSVTSTGAGVIRTQGTTSLAVGAGFTGSLEVNSGTTSASGTVTLIGSLTVQAGATFATINQAITINGDLTNNGSITKGSSGFNINGANTVNNGSIAGNSYNFNSGGMQNLSGTGVFTGTYTVVSPTTVNLTGSVTFGNGGAATSLTLNSGGTIAVGSNTLTLNQIGLNASGTLSGTGAGLVRTQGTSSITSGAGFTAPFEINTGTTSASGTVILGALTVSTGATFATINQAITINGDLTNNGSITKGSGGFGMAGANIGNNGSITGPGYSFSLAGAQSLSGTGSFSGPVTIVSGSTVTLASNHQLATLTVATGGTINTSTFTLFLNGAGSPLSGAGTISNVNVTYNGTAAQTVQTVASYTRLGIDNPAGVTLSAAETVAQRLILTNGVFNNGAFLTMASGATIERSNGTLQIAPTLLGTINIEYTGATDVTTGTEFPTSASVVTNLTINKTTSANTVTLDANRTVNGTLTLTTGRLITTAAFNIILGPAGTASGNANGFVIGNVQKTVAGPGSTVYPVGTATGYSPAAINIDSGTGSFTVTAANGVIGGLAPAKVLNRYWSLSQSGITQADITFAYQQSDVPGPANESGFDFFRDGGTFFAPSALDTANNIATLNNVTQFSDWTLYDPTPNPNTTVTSTADSGPGSLRESILDANALAGADTLVFDGSFSTSQAILLTGGEIVVSDELTITGPGANLLTISGTNSSRIFSIATGETAAFSGFTMTAGNGIGSTGAGSGGAIYNLGDLTLTNVAIDGNSATANGGGIFSQGGTLAISASTVSDNLLAVNGGGIYISSTTATISNSTVSGNSASDGGGINIVTGTVTFSYSTIADNSAGGNGGGVNGPSTAGNTIVGNNTANGTGADYNGTLTSQGYNLIEDPAGANFTGDLTGNVTGQDPNLGPLANNGGPTFTHALIFGSPAVDAADPLNFPATDQCGVARPQNGDLTGSTLPDIGAFELLIPSAAAASVAGTVRANGRPVRSAVVTISDLSGNVKTTKTNIFGNFQFRNVPVGQTYIVSVRAKNYRFESFAISVDDNITGLEINAITARDFRLLRNLP